jgi:hypothetical protein
MGGFMLAHRICTRAAALGPQRVRSAGRVAALAAAVILLNACSQTPQRLAGPDPSDPQAPARPAAYRPVIGPYASQRPVEPLPWRDQNDRLTPAPQP